MALRTSTSCHFPHFLPSLPPANSRHLPWLPPPQRPTTPISNSTFLETIRNPTSALKQILTTYSLAIKTPHFRHDTPTYAALIAYLSTSRHFRAAELVLRRMRRHVLPGPAVLLPLASAYSSAGRHVAASGLFLSFPHSGKVFSSLFRSLVADGEIEVARDLFSGAAKIGFPIKIRYYNELIKGLCDCSRVDDGISIFKGMVDQGMMPDVITFSILMGCLGKEGRIFEVNSLLGKLLKMGVSMDISWYKVLFDVYRRNKMAGDAIQIVQAMKSNGLL